MMRGRQSAAPTGATWDLACAASTCAGSTSAHAGATSDRAATFDHDSAISPSADATSGLVTEFNLCAIKDILGGRI